MPGAEEAVEEHGEFTVGRGAVVLEQVFEVVHHDDEEFVAHRGEQLSDPVLDEVVRRPHLPQAGLAGGGHGAGAVEVEPLQRESAGAGADVDDRRGGRRCGAAGPVALLQHGDDLGGDGALAHAAAAGDGDHADRGVGEVAAYAGADLVAVLEELQAVRDGQADDLHRPGRRRGAGAGGRTGRRVGERRRLVDAEEPGEAVAVRRVDAAQGVVDAGGGQPAETLPAVVFGDDSDNAGACPQRRARHAGPGGDLRIRVGGGHRHGDLQSAGPEVRQGGHGAVRLVEFAELPAVGAAAALPQGEARRVDVDHGVPLVADPPERRRADRRGAGRRQELQHGHVRLRVGPGQAGRRRPLAGPVGVEAHPYAGGARDDVQGGQDGGVRNAVAGSAAAAGRSGDDDLGDAVRVQPAAAPCSPGHRGRPVSPHRPVRRRRSARARPAGPRAPAGASA
ncbi:hypothetical protein V3664_28980 [Streptomyces sp. CS62]